MLTIPRKRLALILEVPLPPLPFYTPLLTRRQNIQNLEPVRGFS